MHIFYTPGINQNEYALCDEESFHAVKVLRLKEHDAVYLIDGVGGFYYARIVEANHKKCTVSVYQTIKEYGKRNYQLTIGIAPTKSIDRFEWFLEKATEIGVDRIIPFVSQQSERKVIKTDRLIKIIKSAMKQSKQAYLPELDELCKFDELIGTNYTCKKFIAHCFDGDKPYLTEVLQTTEDVIILLGPEGDFTTEEVKSANNQGFKNITLGNNRLRTETAGIVAVHSVSMINL